MTTDQFALWKFKAIEGILENFQAADFNTTRFIKGFETYLITYDVAHLTCKIENMSKLDFDPIIVPFKELVNKLKEMGVYRERRTMRHSNSYIPFTGSLEN